MLSNNTKDNKLNTACRFYLHNALTIYKLLHKAVLATFIVTSCMMTTGAMASVYKVTAPDGSVLFTDNPQHYQNNVDMRIEPVTIKSSPVSMSASASSTPNTQQTTPNTQRPILRTTNTTDYNVHIISPEPEQAFRRPAQQIDIAVKISPDLQNGDVVRILLDGKPIAQDLNTSIPTLDLTPGKHTLVVEVVTATQDTVSHESVEFYIIQNTLTYQRNKQLAERLNAYNRLPWYTKVYLHLRQNELHQDAKPVTIHGQTSSSFKGGGSGSAF